MEHRSDNGKYYSEPNLNHYLFRNRNECKRMLGYSFSNRFGWRVTYCFSDCISCIDLYWRFKYTHSHRSDELSMEYGADNCKYYG